MLKLTGSKMCTDVTGSKMRTDLRIYCFKMCTGVYIQA